MSNSKPVYFPGLDGLRFFAAISVVFYHIEQIKVWFGIKPDGGSDFFLNQIVLHGEDAVSLFFVLSGFLITYLLLVENAQNGSINIRWFYVRRTLRIWPLYYLIMLLGFVGLPLLELLLGYPGYYPLYDDSPIKVAIKFGLYLFFLPNVSAFAGSFVTGIGHLWSIGLEEQFYLIWPQVFRRFSQNLLKIILIFIGIKLSLIGVAHIISPLEFVPVIVKTGINFLVFFQIEHMAIGAVAAILLYQHRDLVNRWLFHPVVEKSVLLVALSNIFLFDAAQDKPLLRFIMGIVYAVLILNICANERALKLEHRIMNKLGRISYGIYMYQVLVIYVVMLAFDYSGHPLGNSLIENLVLYGLVTGITLGLAQLSYRFFELPFLRLKERFAVVSKGTGQNVEQGVKQVSSTI